MDFLEHKNILGTVEYSKADKILHGKLLKINGLVTYEADKVEDLEKEFINAVEEYLEFCKENNIEVKEKFSGSFNVRVPEELHEKMYYQSVQEGVAMNFLVKEAIAEYIAKK